MKSLNSNSEILISNEFNKRSDYFDKEDDKGLSKTAEIHVKQIVTNKSKTALDVGSGTGGILEKLLENNIDFVYGIDLAPKMIERTSKRLEKKGYLKKSKVENISYLDFLSENKIEAVSLHKVLCCHPDRLGMLDKTLSLQPKLIVLTIPRTRFFLKIATFLLVFLRKIKKGFRPYLHSIKEVDSQLLNRNYELIDVYKTFLWTTRTYIINMNNNE
jgi:SAM-dependent methyltransferase